ncbi:MAG: hypothetical protein U1F59_09095 [Candidatus Competibacteraceae bacterium]
MNTEDSLSKLIAVRLGIFDLRALAGLLQLGVIRLVVESPRCLAPEHVGIEGRIGDRRPQPPTERRLDVADVGIPPQPALAQPLRIFRDLVRAAPGKAAPNTASAATIPDFIAVWSSMILGMLRKPAVSPISTPPGKVNLGIDWKPAGRGITPRAVGDAPATLEGGPDVGMSLEALELVERRQVRVGIARAKNHEAHRDLVVLQVMGKEPP